MKDNFGSESQRLFARYGTDDKETQNTRTCKSMGNTSSVFVRTEDECVEVLVRALAETDVALHERVTAGIVRLIAEFVAPRRFAEHTRVPSRTRRTAS